nr:tropomyosin [Nomia melanderi]XP_031826905.1 tropomyosin [Nomia melanderi]XP_031826906.1 tropomyosin [Nomia melanderi]XP_031826907.1 tropomyosin [Nomia melanderi]XP_031826908.1 tropomyosin [Nomia melanderi]
MSDAETVKSDASQEPCNAGNAVPSGAENASAPAAEGASPPEAAAPEVAQDARGQSADTPKNETNVAEINNETVPINGAAVESEAAIDPKKPVEENATVPECNSEPSSRVAELQEQAAIGAGDTCSLPRPDKEASDQQPGKQIGDQLAPPESKVVADENSKASDDKLVISKLTEEIKKTTMERNCYQQKLEKTEKKLAELQVSYDALLKGEGDEVLLRRMVDQLKAKLVHTSLQLEDRIRTVSNQEKQISALNSQVASLKEVESLTRSLLQIRNLEVKQLQSEVDEMEERISEERERYSTMINKMDAAVKLNADLKKEYETQLRLFRDLREKYEEKVSLLSEEKRNLENSAQPVP